MATVSSSQSLQKLAGQPGALRRLTLALERPSHAYLFVGPEHAGKRTAALSFAQALICERQGCGHCPTCRMVVGEGHPDVRVWELADGESTFKVERVREVIAAVQRKPFQAARQIHILAALDQTQPAGTNALLKTLEEPPETTTLVLLARDIENVLPTLVSRCQVVPFGLTPPPAIVEHLTGAFNLDETRARLIANQSEGRMGKAISLATEPQQPSPEIDWPQAGSIAAIAWSDRLAALTGPAQQAQLTALIVWIRDAAWLSAGGNPAGVIRHDDLPRLQSVAQERPAAQWVQMAEAVETARTRLERHGNARLVLDALAKTLTSR